MKFQHLDREYDGRVARVRLRAPVGPLGLGAGELDELSRVLDDLEAEDGLRVLLLAYDGAGEAPGEAAAESRQAAVVEQLARCTRPVIAALRGPAYGVALELALACDLRIGAAGAEYGMPGIRAGRMPFAGATQRLPRLIGQGRAFDMVLTGDPLGAEQALRAGLIQRLAAAGQVDEHAGALAEAMAAASPTAMSLTKEALHGGLDLTLEQGLRMELDLYLLLFSTEDRVEGIRAFQGKRKPNFQGR
ncbi:MAG: enoyl-CoA hydratase/isomerase family protein [Ramlibacter sp.]|nr:enoyl-CoA hydratase/isomerase family protein [Ramlibacter sp.]